MTRDSTDWCSHDYRHLVLGSKECKFGYLMFVVLY